MTQKKMKQFYKVTKGEILAGVCTGLAKYFNFDVTLIRVTFVLFVFGWEPLATGTVLVYIILALLAPRDIC